MSERRSSVNVAGPAVPLLDPNDPAAVMKYVGAAVASLVLMKVLYSALFALSIIAFPLVYLYAIQQCPSNESFDAKKELKRVLRGHHLPDGHPDKPQGFLSETLNRVQASLGTELATAPGYEVTIYDILGACKVAVVTVPTIERDLYWLGGFARWTYLFQRDLSVKTKVD